MKKVLTALLTLMSLCVAAQPAIERRDVNILRFASPVFIGTVAKTFYGDTTIPTANGIYWWVWVDTNTVVDDKTHTIMPDPSLGYASNYAWKIIDSIKYNIHSNITGSKTGNLATMHISNESNGGMQMSLGDELPYQSGNSGKHLQTNGTAVSWVSPKFLTSLAISGAINKIITATMSNGDTVQTPAMKIPVVYSGTTNASGIYAVTFATAYSVAPNIQANVIGQGTEVQSRIVSCTTTGFSVHVYQRVAVLTLALSTATTNVSGAAVDVIITSK